MVITNNTRPFTGLTGYSATLTWNILSKTVPTILKISKCVPSNTIELRPKNRNGLNKTNP